MKGLPGHLKAILGQQKRSKYGNHKVHCLSKHLHDSKLEANYCNRLLAMKQAKEIRDYEVHVKFDLNVQNVLICKHIVDFLVHYHGFGNMEIHDTKGVHTPDWIIKRKLCEAIYPHIRYVVVTRD